MRALLITIALLMICSAAEAQMPNRQRDPWLGLHECEKYNASHAKQYDCSVYCRGYEFYNQRSDYVPPLPPECDKYRKERTCQESGCGDPDRQCWTLVSDPPRQVCGDFGGDGSQPIK